MASSNDDDDCVPELVSATNIMPDESATNQLKLRQDQERASLRNNTSKVDDDDDSTSSSSWKNIPAVPLVILSGFLGSGKTTLIQYVLSAQHGMRIAVIVNEFEFGRSIEKGLTVRSAEASDDEWMELKNGCMCCSAKSQSVQALEQLVTKRKGQLDAILIETAGLADPVPIARSFWLDDALQAKVQLAGIVVVVDSSNIEKYIKSEKTKFVEAARQLLSADRIIMNKIDVCYRGGEDNNNCENDEGLCFQDDQEKVDEFLFGANRTNSCPEILRRAGQTVREVNPVAPITLTCLKTLLGVSSSSKNNNKNNNSSVAADLPTIDKLKKLLLLSGSNQVDDNSKQQQQEQGQMMKWNHQQSQHTHTSNLNSTQIEICNRAFKSVRDVDFFFAHILDNSVDGQDEHDEELPAQLKAQERGSVIIRSKSAVWVEDIASSVSKVADDDDSNSNDSDDHNNKTTTRKYLAYQVQSIGSTFEAVPMAGLNNQHDQQHEQQHDNDDILRVGVNRMLLLGFGLRHDEIRNEFMKRSVEMK